LAPKDAADAHINDFLHPDVPLFTGPFFAAGHLQFPLYLHTALCYNHVIREQRSLFVYERLSGMKKVYVEVFAEFTSEGLILPRYFVWEDGRRFAVDRVLDIRPAASLKAGGIGTRYTCSICGKRTYMFLDEDRWFMEGK
jgi:hypothetical protein